MRPKLIAEAVGTGLLLYVIVGSGILVERSGQDPATALFIHAVVVGTGLAALIAFLAPVSGAQFNPAVTLALWRAGEVPGPHVGPYLLAQFVGGGAGVVLANISFEVAGLTVSGNDRLSFGNLVGEIVATLGLVALILVLVRRRHAGRIPAAVGAWVATCIVATPSTGFANPAVTLARIMTDTYTGIAPEAVPGFVAAQLVGMGLALALLAAVAPRDVKEMV
jgi:glycerol uptake facilitator-like aquaporin